MTQIVIKRFMLKKNGSAAAPTAGLHFTKELLEEIKAKGVHLVYLTLHVGLGTFRPVSVDNIEEHHMHSEFYRLTEEAAKQLNEVRQAGGRIVAVGTTSIRTLETIGTKFNGEIQADSGWTDIFITPGYQFKVVEAFSTNFHLPKSTLVMLVSAFAGKDLTLAAYQHAIEENIVSLVLAMQCLLNKRHFVSRILGIETKIYYDKHVIFGITVKVCFIFSSL